MNYKTYPRYKSFDFTDVLEEMTRPSETYAQIAARNQIVRDQLARSENELADRMGETKYSEWRAAMIRPLDDLGEKMRKIDEQIARLSCGACPFDFDPGCCGVYHEHGLKDDRPLPFDRLSDYAPVESEERNV